MVLHILRQINRVELNRQRGGGMGSVSFRSRFRQSLQAARRAELGMRCGKVMGVQLPWMTELGRPRVQRRLPVVLSQEELAAVFRGLEGEHLLFAQLLYGTGMRLTEGLQLRVKDVDDFQHRAIIGRAGKGDKDRILMLPDVLVHG